MNVILVFWADARACSLTFQGFTSLGTGNKSKYPRLSTSISTKYALKSHSLDPRRITEIADWRLLPFDLILSSIPPAGYFNVKDNTPFSRNSSTVQECERIFLSLCHLLRLSRNNASSIEYRHIEKGKPGSYIFSRRFLSFFSRKYSWEL